MAVAPMILELCENIMARSTMFSRKLEITEMDDVEKVRLSVGTTSRMLFKFAKRYLDMIKERPMKT